MIVLCLYSARVGVQCRVSMGVCQDCQEFVVSFLKDVFLLSMGMS